MKALILNGSHKNQSQLSAEQEVLEQELGKKGWTTESILLHEYNIKSCIGCFRCWHTTPGICTGVKGDQANEITEKVIKSDLVVFLTPLTFGGYSSELKRIIERFLGLLQPGTTIVEGEVHHLKRYERYPSVLALATTNALDREGEQLFIKLGDRHSLNFYPPKHHAEVLIEGEENLSEKISNIIDAMEVPQK